MRVGSTSGMCAMRAKSERTRGEFECDAEREAGRDRRNEGQPMDPRWSRTKEESSAPSTTETIPQRLFGVAVLTVNVGEPDMGDSSVTNTRCAFAGAAEASVSGWGLGQEGMEGRRTREDLLHGIE